MKSIRHPYNAPIVALLVLTCHGLVDAGQEMADSWPQLRGPTRDGRFVGPTWPESLQGDRFKPLWRVALGPSYSGAVVSKDRVFVTETVDEKYEVVRALDRKTGHEIWKTRWEGYIKMKAYDERMGNWLKGTPTFDGESLFVSGARDVLVCLDAASGKERWRVDFAKRYGTPLPEYGFISSPLVVDGGVYVLAADSVVGVDKVTGKSLWRSVVRDKPGHGAYSSAEFGVLHGRPQILASTIPAINGLDPRTGEVLWRKVIDSQALGCILPPYVYGDGVFTSSRGSATGFYPITKSGEKFSVDQAWKNRLVAYYSYPVIIEDHAYMHLRNGRMACINLKTGEQSWISSERLGQSISTIVQGDRMLTLSSDGDLRLIRATPDKFDLIDERNVGNTSYTHAHLGMAGREVFVRELRSLVVFEWEN